MVSKSKVVNLLKDLIKKSKEERKRKTLQRKVTSKYLEVCWNLLTDKEREIYTNYDPEKMFNCAPTYQYHSLYSPTGWITYKQIFEDEYDTSVISSSGINSLYDFFYKEIGSECSSIFSDWVGICVGDSLPIEKFFNKSVERRLWIDFNLDFKYNKETKTFSVRYGKSDLEDENPQEVKSKEAEELLNLTIEYINQCRRMISVLRPMIVEMIKDEMTESILKKIFNYEP